MDAKTFWANWLSQYGLAPVQTSGRRPPKKKKEVVHATSGRKPRTVESAGRGTPPASPTPSIDLTKLRPLAHEQPGYAEFIADVRTARETPSVPGARPPPPFRRASWCSRRGSKRGASDAA